MKEEYQSPEEFAADVARHARDAWVNGTFRVNGALVGIKAHGKWVQRIEAHGVRDSGDFPTQKAMKEFIIERTGGAA